MSIGQTWNLPPSFITGLILSVVIAPENVSEKFENEYKVNIQGTEFNVSELWGQRQKIRAWMETEYGRPIFNSQL
jgi:poly-D-alanine transfer protein DltD